MSGSGRRERRKLFERYSRDLAKHRPELNGRFMCPICGRDFPPAALDGNELARAHVMPKGLGLRLETLSCRRCDNDIGKVNAHAVREKRHSEWGQGKGRIRFRLAHSGNRAIAVETRWREGELSLYGNPRKEPPNAWDWLQGLAETSNAVFTLSTQAADSTKICISLLHSAFLMMFHTFGYEYALSENAATIRSILALKVPVGEFRRAVWSATGGDPAGLLNRPPFVAIAARPADLRCFVVSFPPVWGTELGRVVVLPGFGPEGLSSYQRLLGGSQPPHIAKMVKIQLHPTLQQYPDVDVARTVWELCQSDHFLANCPDTVTVGAPCSIDQPRVDAQLS